ncbi:acetaldehyde dehydrogenase [Klebsiella pneumoniae]|uniref:Acetaldehyde dehydrogenase n=2 Tax=Klebsiella pneumoniae TaxID=573 RepID=A0A378BA57_KLEPO|nr:acetaldehyde dehydrogenase [Klebsiella pneumoniae]STV33684.1 acetaldehyde dehydrogenase [Klebsiella pneumoniae subsp. ozaenae]SQC25058.1 acetaldehyde dehydrogenase [Klebsiella pneumoniae]STR98129.1 acetaldehyde dehydrogenase [Klebsiella pneumoniae]STS66723.1 acetaldehyde dehydrogenase [Klebsiella pneumoniae]
MRKRKVAIIGSGNIGTDLMIKILRHGQHLEMAVMVGIDPQSDGLARARRLGVATTHEGVGGLMQMAEFADIDFVFDATSAGAHIKNDAALREAKPGIRVIDLRRAGDHPDGRRGLASGEGALRGDCGLDRQPIRRAGHAGQY